MVDYLYLWATLTKGFPFICLLQGSELSLENSLYVCLDSFGLKPEGFGGDCLVGVKGVWIWKVT